MTKSMDLAYTLGLMEENMRVIGKMVNNMVRVRIFILMEW